MSIMQKRMVNQTVSRFIVKNFEASNAECFVDNLDILEAWEDYRVENVQSYIINSKLILEKFPEIFRECTVGEYRVNGISKRKPKERAVKKQLTAEELQQLGKDSEMKARFEKFLYDRGPSMRTAPFETFQLANFKQTELAGGSYRMVCGECSLEDAREWLARQDFLYFDDKIECWCFHSRPV